MHGMGFKPSLELIVYLEEIGAGAIHLVDESQTGDAVFVGLTPYGFGLRLHTADRAINHARAIEHAHRAFHLDGVVNVPLGLNDIDAAILVVTRHAAPECRRCRPGNGAPPLLFLLPPLPVGRPALAFAAL